MARTLPMFPLGNVLVPTAVLPLHVFEPRYRALVTDVLDTDEEFGVVLIDRGHEVGGGDLRTDLGTVAKVMQAQQFDDGRWAVVGAGTTRFRVREWLDDDPYPRAVVDELPEAAGEGAEEARAAAVAVLRRVLALAAELGASAPAATTEIDQHPVTASYNVLALAPLGPHDQQRLLGIDDAATRLRATTTELTELAQELEGRMRLAAEGGDDPEPGR